MKPVAYIHTGYTRPYLQVAHLPTLSLNSMELLQGLQAQEVYVFCSLPLISSTLRLQVLLPVVSIVKKKIEREVSEYLCLCVCCLFVCVLYIVEEVVNGVEQIYPDQYHDDENHTCRRFDGLVAAIFCLFVSDGNICSYKPDTKLFSCKVQVRAVF